MTIKMFRQVKHHLVLLNSCCNINKKCIKYKITKQKFKYKITIKYNNQQKTIQLHNIVRSTKIPYHRISIRIPSRWKVSAFHSSLHEQILLKIWGKNIEFLLGFCFIDIPYILLWGIYVKKKKIVQQHKKNEEQKYFQ